MNRSRRRWRRLERSWRVRAGLLLLSIVALPAIFAEAVAGDAPIVAAGPGVPVVLPALVQPAGYPSLTDPEGIEAHHRGHFAVWPLVRQGPGRTSTLRDAPMTAAHPFGTDARGRDRFARVVYGGRRALGIAALSVFLSVLLGGLLGAIAGLSGGFWDELLSRPIEIVEAFPTVIVVVVLRAIDPGSGVWPLLVAVVTVRWAEVARLVRGEVVRVSAADFVLAARALGCPPRRVLTRHILPHAVRPVIVSAMFGVASVVLLEVAVGFLGLGVEGSWGAMLAEGLRLGGAPGTGNAVAGTAALAVTVAGTYLLADATGEAADARVHSLDRPQDDQGRAHV